MKLGIMQPYFFPYIGYFQLMKAVDKYVVYDDVNYIKGGWMNRNRILVNGKDFMMNIQLQAASPNKKINEIAIGNNADKLLKTFAQAYRRAPYFAATYPVIERIMNSEEKNLALFLANSFVQIANYLGFDTEFIISSNIEKDNELRGQDKVLAICEILGATEYYNAIGGQELYDKDAFSEKGIELHFLQTNSIVYKQFHNEFVPGLSIIDVLMFNSVEEVNKMLDDYTLI